MSPTLCPQAAREISQELGLSTSYVTDTATAVLEEGDLDAVRERMSDASSGSPASDPKSVLLGPELGCSCTDGCCEIDA